MIESIAIITGIASAILNAVISLKNIQTEKKKKVYDFFIEIADTLDEAITKFKNNEVPHGACEQMRQYALRMPEVLDGVLDRFDVQNYSHGLYHAHDIERLLISVREDANAMTQLEIAAGNFRAAASLFKVKL